MDALPDLGTAISAIVKPTFDAYAPLLLSQRDRINSTQRETFTYGPHARQKLDLYTPSSSKPQLSRVLVFMYGGGLVTGDRIMTNPFDGLVYANLGHYFATHLDSWVAIVDYRLLQHGAKYPSGAEDLSLALEWLITRLSVHSIVPLNVFIMGNSAGGVHAATFLLAPPFAELRSRLLQPHSQMNATLKGVILVSVPYHFGNAHKSRIEVLRSYYGDDVRKHCPLGLLEDAGIVDDVKVMATWGELDPKDEILDPYADFVGEWHKRKSRSSRLLTSEMKGHNHISPVLGVGTGLPKEEEWARSVIDFINAQSDTAS